MRRCALRGAFLLCGSTPGSGGMRGGTSHTPVNARHFRDDTPCFSLKGNNDWWEG